MDNEELNNINNNPGNAENKMPAEDVERSAGEVTDIAGENKNPAENAAKAEDIKPIIDFEEDQPQRRPRPDGQRRPHPDGQRRPRDQFTYRGDDHTLIQIDVTVLDELDHCFFLLITVEA